MFEKVSRSLKYDLKKLLVHKHGHQHQSLYPAHAARAHCACTLRVWGKKRKRKKRNNSDMYKKLFKSQVFNYNKYKKIATRTTSYFSLWMHASSKFYMLVEVAWSAVIFSNIKSLIVG